MKIYLIGGDGYIGTRLQEALDADELEYVVIDPRVYGDKEGEDVGNVYPPEEPAIVVWLASFHRTPPGYSRLAHSDREKWEIAYAKLMQQEAEKWALLGHSVIYISSMQLVTNPGDLYSMSKSRAERLLLTPEVNSQILRFGTVWGSLDQDPARPQTAVNAALLGTPPDEHYIAYTTHMRLAIDAIMEAIYSPFLNTIKCVVDDLVPATRETFEFLIDRKARKLNTWQKLFLQEARRISSDRAQELSKQTHPTELLARFYDLPWPKEAKS